MASERYELTPADIDICDQFEALLKRLVTGTDRMSSASASWISRNPSHAWPNASVQDAHEAFSGDFEHRTLASQLQNALAKFDAVHLTDEERKAKRIAELKADLARLEQAA